MVGLSYTSDNGTRRQHQNLMKRGMLSKSGILRNWGQPERISKTGGVVTMEFHSRKWEMNPPPPGPVVLKFSGDRLTYVEAWFEDNGRYRSPSYIIP